MRWQGMTIILLKWKDFHGVRGKQRIRVALLPAMGIERKGRPLGWMGGSFAGGIGELSSVISAGCE